ncbi:hypothetical protein ES705_32961 [subsurface metagenome]
MKKVILSIIILTFLVGCGVTPDNGEFIACIKELDTPQKIGSYMLENFEYEIHDFYTLEPYELWQTKKGDCDDFSAFGVFVADYHSYETWQIKIYDNTFYTHYVAIYDEDIWYSITDNRNYHFGFDSFREIVDYVCEIRDKVWTKYIVYDYWNDEIEVEYN